MLGHAGGSELAFYGIAFSSTNLLFVTGLGVLTGTVVLISQAMGQGNPRLCGSIWLSALVHGLGLGLFFAALLLLGGAALESSAAVPVAGGE